ncbi:hypothetical protein SAMN06298216_1200 [Spirosomataceae bacterium TFI 002]|nr:hypothetical protein SAMN06298216_1200 [Spirosomataceae bacterium TFI 002]
MIESNLKQNETKNFSSFLIISVLLFSMSNWKLFGWEKTSSVIVTDSENIMVSGSNNGICSEFYSETLYVFGIPMASRSDNRPVACY